MDENTNQTFLSYSGRPCIYLYFHLHSELSCNMPNTYRIRHFTHHACLHHYSLTCQAAGEHQLHVHKLNTAFSPKYMLIPMWIEDSSGKQGSNTELMFGVLHLLGRVNPPQQKLGGWNKELIWVLHKDKPPCLLTRVQDVFFTYSERFDCSDMDRSTQ